MGLEELLMAPVVAFLYYMLDAYAFWPILVQLSSGTAWLYMLGIGVVEISSLGAMLRGISNDI